jgi:hypothetical protein
VLLLPAELVGWLQQLFTCQIWTLPSFAVTLAPRASSTSDIASCGARILPAVNTGALSSGSSAAPEWKFALSIQIPALTSHGMPSGWTTSGWSQVES